jgi:hypothetical protein
MGERENWTRRGRSIMKECMNYVEEEEEQFTVLERNEIQLFFGCAGTSDAVMELQLVPELGAFVLGSQMNY